MAKALNKKSPITRSGARRLGDDYQDQVAIDVLVDWLEHSERYAWVKVEADDAGALDDVTAEKRDGTLFLRQVKFSTNPDAVDDYLTWEMLLACQQDKTGRARLSWLQKWARSLADAQKNGQAIDAALESNRQPAEDFRTTLQADNLVDYDRVAAAIRLRIESQLGSESNARSFFGGFRFHLNRSNLAELEDGLRRRFYNRGGSDAGWQFLKQQVRRWVCYREEPSNGGRITLAEVKARHSGTVFRHFRRSLRYQTTTCFHRSVSMNRC